MKFHSKRLAVGGMFTALSVVILLLGGVTGIGTFSAPMLAGICTMLVLQSANVGTAVLQWMASALLGLIISPDKELAVIYLLVFGWYPIAKKHFDGILKAPVRCILKFAVFNGSIALTYLLLWAVLYGFDWNASGYGSTLATALYLLAGNVIFALYDKVLSVFTRRFTGYQKK